MCITCHLAPTSCSPRFSIGGGWAPYLPAWYLGLAWLDAVSPTGNCGLSRFTPPRAQALDGSGHPRSQEQPPTSPALSTASTADGDDDADPESSPPAPALPAPKLSDRVSALLRSPTRANDDLFETASWGSPYPPDDRNVRRQSFSSDLSEESPIHNLDIDTPFLRTIPQFPQQPDAETREPLSAAAAVLANRVRRSNRGLTEDWIRAHTAADQGNIEPRLWLSDGSDSEHSSLSGSELAWLGELTPRAVKAARAAKKQTRQPRLSASIETLKPTEGKDIKLGNSASMASEPERVLEPAVKVPPQHDEPIGQSVEEGSYTSPTEQMNDAASNPSSNHSGALRDAPVKPSAETLTPTPIPSTPKRLKEKSLPKEPLMTPRIKKKVPWRGKNIMILVPRDEDRGKPGKAPVPLRPAETTRMFASWKELGYNVDGFDLFVKDYQPIGTDDSQSRDCWPSADELTQERSTGHYQVTLPDLNAWKNYVQELQEAKLRALGVSDATDEPPAPSISPTLTIPSRQASAQYPPLPFSPPIPTSSASSNNGFNFQSQLLSGTTTTTQSPGIASPIPFGQIQGKFNTRQSISLPAGNSPFQMSHVQGWQHQAGILQSLARIDSPLLSLNGLISPHSPYDMDGFPISGSPAFNAHQRHQSLQYFPQQMPRASPHLQQVREDEEEEVEDHAKSPSKTPEPTKQQQVSMHAEMQDAQYHLEEQLRNQLEHEDYNPQARGSAAVHHENLASAHNRQASGNLAVSEHFAHDQVKPVVLHHPRPHSRGQSQTFFREHDTPADESTFGRLNGIPEANKPEADEAYEIETNPSNLGTPVQSFDFPAMTHPHQKTMSTASNPWNTVNESVEVPDHERKISSSKLNVKAPEFKFNPTSNFTPGMFNFSSAPIFRPGAAAFEPAIFQAGAAAFEPAVFQAAVHDYAEPAAPVAEFGSSRFGVKAGSPSFTPGKSEFSFSTSGPKFRPDAPAFTPFQSLAKPLDNSRKGHQGRTDSIFGDINIVATEIARSSRKSNAIPIIRPSSRSSAKSPLLGVAEDSGEDQMDSDGRPIQDESRAKRAKSLAPENEEVASFAQMPLASISESTNDNALFIDTSMSSAGTGDMLETKQTTAVPSEISPATKEEWRPLQTAKDAVINSHKAQHSAELKSKKQAHKRNSLSATAIVFSPGAMSYGDESPVTLTRAEPSPVKMTHSVSISEIQRISPHVSDESQFSSAMPSARPKGLKASRFARAAPASVTPPAATPVPILTSAPEPQYEQETLQNTSADIIPSIEAQNTLVGLSEEPVKTDAKTDEPTFEEIDAVMQQMKIDPNMGVKKKPLEKSMWNQPTPVASRQPSYTLRPVAHEFVPEFSQPVPPYPKDPLLEDPFIDPPDAWANGQQQDDMPASDWEGAFSEDEHSKLESRTQFFDGRVNEISALGNKSRRAPSSRRDIRSTTSENQESDADDEDDELILNRSMSPRRDRRMDQIRVVVTEALAAQLQNVHTPTEVPVVDHSAVLAALEEVKEQMSTFKSMPRLDREIEHGHDEDIRPSTSKSDDAILAKLDQLQTKNIDLEQRLQFEQHKIEKEVQERREAEDAAAELNRKLNAAETRVEVEIINKSVYDQRVGDLEERLRLQEDRTEEELKQRRLLEDKLCDVQRQLKHASEEETRLTETLEERDRRIKELEQLAGKKAMRMTLLEAASSNASQSQSEMTNKLNTLEGDLKEIRQDNTHWRNEAERADESARRNAGELAVVRDENKGFQNTIQILAAQLQENERLRESWRGKFMSLQEDMANAAREVAEESARRIKKDQAMLARQEVLDARLQAEARTRERLEVEMERLQTNERSGMRALKECTRLEGIMGELRTEKDQLQQSASRYLREFEEARESGASEVNRTRMSMQTEIDAANHQVNVVRQELEDQNNKLRAEIDNIRLETDTAKERNEMLLEEEQTTKVKLIEELERKHQNEIEDMQTRFERQINNTVEDSQRSEEALLERLSLSSSKMEHLKDRILHLEDKLEISKQAAAAAAQAAKAAATEPTRAPSPAPATTTRVAVSSNLPEKISPQALRESIMVLQEQLQAREQRIEELEQDVSNLDPEAPSKISKRDDEISWLRELLAVRHGDLQDIIAALAVDSFDRERVKDAAIRLKANLQMEEQERERAINGGSSITLPNIAQSIQAATPRVAQTIGSGFNAFDRWRKSSQPSSFFSGVLNSPSAATPSRSKGPSAQQSRLLSGLLTPPASSLRQTPAADNKPQPTAFGSTGRRFPSHGSVQNRTRGESKPSALAEDEEAAATKDTTPPRRQEQPADPVTPLMIRQSGYDSDAQPGDFDDHDFFED
ncbi:myosin class II heavy chain (MHC), putative [Cordyceps militaris CM01]|uniref:Myosin class II heavy chain (MHC), putative n=1 Tax=Cordyceps militaris (strain CM01) TaxID=983644 RepID=G3JA41_CORMM|nr:myosin class II heavy chain (MHC), putative [Cordyceps militaris CM01]EGX95061.1 myosin class II heavy chain (MHC), putative [Cordyceps militaris CM01]